MNQAQLPGMVLIALGVVWAALAVASRKPSAERRERADSGASLATAMLWAGRAQAKAFTIAAAALAVGSALLLTG